MKKLIYPISIAALLLASCGDSSAEASPDSNDAKATLSACDCKKEANKLAEEMKLAASSGDELKMKEKETKLDDLLEEDCKDYSKEDYEDCE